MGGKVTDVTVIQTYAPTSNATEEDRELFYRQLETHVNKYRKYYVVIVGDFNAKLGKRTNENEKGQLEILPSEKELIMEKNL